MKRLFTLVSLIIPLTAFANGGWGGHMGGGWFPMFGGMMWCWFILIALFFVGLGLAIYLIIRKVGGTQKTEGGSASVDDPMTILKNRYAKGEITREQYDEMKKDILSE